MMRPTAGTIYWRSSARTKPTEIFSHCKRPNTRYSRPRIAPPGEDPIGERINSGTFTEPTEIEIVGVARDAKYRTMGEDSRNMIYVLYAQQPALLMTVLARALYHAAESRGGPQVRVKRRLEVFDAVKRSKQRLAGR